MKSEIVLQYAGKDVQEDSIVKLAEDVWTAAGNKLSDIKSMKIYAQPENSVAYYVINDDFKGSVAI